MMSCKRKFFQWGSLLIVYRALNLTVQYAKSGAYMYVGGCLYLTVTFILIQIASSKLDLQPGSLSKIVPVQSLSCIKVGTLTPLVGV